MQPSNPYAPPQAVVQDIVSLGPMVPADRGMRLAAWILDGVVVMGMVYVPFLLGMVAAGVQAGAAGVEAGGSDLNVDVALGVGGLLALAGFAVWCWLTIRFVWRNGQSIGKRMVGIKVVRADGSRASLARIFWLRNVVHTMLTAVTFNMYTIVDGLFIFGESRQCLHDKIADTIVIQA